MKKFRHSKINWLAFILIAVEVFPAIMAMDIRIMTVQDWITSGIGLVVIIVRTWYTNQPIKTKKAIREKRKLIRS